jgi:F0F1-type ATP synthase membrane subunit c/vacuolar-type H+-ATPase subunit K
MTQVQSKLEKGENVQMEALQQEQTRFFIKVAIAESIPILLIVYGFMAIGNVIGEDINIMFPLIIIAAVYLFAVFNLIQLRRDTLGYNKISVETKNIVNTLIFICLGLLSAIPIISVVAIMTITGQ